MHPAGKENVAKESDRPKASHHTSRSDFLCRVKHKNTLPDIPFDKKSLAYPFESNRFVQYSATTLERNFKHDLLAEADLGYAIDLIDLDAYGTAEEKHDALDEIDAMLVEEEATPQGDKKRSRQHAKSVSWLRKTEYISTEYNRFQTSNETPETKLGYNVKKMFQEKDIYKDRQSQIDAIEGSFEAAKKPVLRHHTKPGVTAKEVLPLLPDFDMWKFPYAHVVFDTDPALSGRPEKEQLEEMSQATIRGMEDDEKEQFVGFFVPTKETKEKRRKQGRISEQTETDEYLMVREYNWSVKNKSTKGFDENYFFLVRDGEGVFYNELETRVRLNKRRAKKGASTGSSILVVNHRDINEDELKAQRERLAQLEPPVLEEEEEEEEFAIAAKEKAAIADVFGSSDEDDEDDGGGEGRGEKDNEKSSEDSLSDS
ncbi:RNA polymerase II-associated factor 1 homolog isoform X2 [Oscarella lobularis]|uniref:RNA polymerase II-associated factor 1 homolog isoform X2 n=1 Tax=Oscarella lobularis TaxID=121494 RepID=UPI0033139AB6